MEPFTAFQSYIPYFEVGYLYILHYSMSWNVLDVKDACWCWCAPGQTGWWFVPGEQRAKHIPKPNLYFPEMDPQKRWTRLSRIWEVIWLMGQVWRLKNRNRCWLLFLCLTTRPCGVLNDVTHLRLDLAAALELLSQPHQTCAPTQLGKVDHEPIQCTYRKKRQHLIFWPTFLLGLLLALAA